MSKGSIKIKKRIRKIKLDTERILTLALYGIGKEGCIRWKKRGKKWKGLN
jgi:hypothetical protein